MLARHADALARRLARESGLPEGERARLERERARTIGLLRTVDADGRSAPRRASGSGHP